MKLITHESYEKLVRVHCIPALGDLQLNAIPSHRGVVVRKRRAAKRGFVLAGGRVRAGDIRTFATGGAAVFISEVEEA